MALTTARARLLADVGRGIVGKSSAGWVIGGADVDAAASRGLNWLLTEGFVRVEGRPRPGAVFDFRPAEVTSRGRDALGIEPAPAPDVDELVARLKVAVTARESAIEHEDAALLAAEPYISLRMLAQIMGLSHEAVRKRVRRLTSGADVSKGA